MGKTNIYKKITALLLGTTVALTPSCGKTSNNNQQKEETIDSTVEDNTTNNSMISKNNYYSIIKSIQKANEKKGIINSIPTEENIKKVTNLSIEVENERENLNFLKDFKNLENLTITINDENVENIKNLPQLLNLKTLSIKCENGLFTNEDRTILEEKVPNLKKLCFKSKSMIYEPGAIELLKNIETLGLNPGINCDIDLSKLKSINTLEIYNKRPYDIAIWFNSKEYNTLKENNINIKFEENVEEKYLEISQKLDEIVEKLDIDESSSDKEKYDAILIYVLDNLKYDSEVKTANQNNIEHSELTLSFYENGKLYGALEKETQICGNYSALVEALFDRVSSPWNSYIIKNERHSWNIVRIDGDVYYVDSTWLDGLDVKIMNTNMATILIKQGLTEGMDWYMHEIQSNSTDEENDKSHIPTHFPKYFEEDYDINNYIQQYSEILDETSTPLDFKTYTDDVQVNIKNRRINTQIGAVIGALQGINASYQINYINKQQIIEEQSKVR